MSGGGSIPGVSPICGGDQGTVALMEVTCGAAGDLHKST